jgi:hypothetical protein
MCMRVCSKRSRSVSQHNCSFESAAARSRARAREREREREGDIWRMMFTAAEARLLRMPRARGGSGVRPTDDIESARRINFIPPCRRGRGASVEWRGDNKEPRARRIRRTAMARDFFRRGGSRFEMTRATQLDGKQCIMSRNNERTCAGSTKKSSRRRARRLVWARNLLIA